MKKYLFFIILCFTLTASAEGIELISNFAFHSCTILDRDFNVMQEIPSESGDPIGLYALAKADGKEYIVVTIGEKSAYDIQVVNVVQGKAENNSRIDMYQGGMTFQGQIVPINVFLEYNVKRNKYIPETITIDINNSPNFIQLSGLIPVHK